MRLKFFSIVLIVLGVLSVSTVLPPAPIYYVKVLSPIVTAGGSASVIAAPLEIAKVQFTDIKHVIGQHNRGAFTVTLQDSRGRRELQSVYDTLNYEQRVEFYNDRNLLGRPDFAGVITGLQGDLADSLEISGESSLRRLYTRSLRRYHSYNTTANLAIANLCKTYQVIFKDDFNRASIGTDWSVTAGAWLMNSYAAGTYSIFPNGIQTLGSNAATSVIDTAASYTEAQWDDMYIYVELWPTSASDSRISYLRNSGAGTEMRLKIHSSVDFGVITLTLYKSPTESAANTIASRSVPIAGFVSSMNPGAMHSIEIYETKEGSNRRHIVLLNGVEMINVTDSTSLTGSRNIALHGDGAAVADFDNFMVCTKTAMMQPKFLTNDDSVTINQVFNGISQLEAIDWFCDHHGYEYRVQYDAGDGNDVLLVGTNIGTDMSKDLIFEEGVNVQNMRKDRTSDGVATSLFTFGKSSDDALSNVIAKNLSAMTTYGIVDGEWSDEQVDDPTIARIIGNNRLAIAGAGAVSISGEVVDESELWRAFDPARVGIGRVGRMVTGSVKSWLRVADHAFFKSTKLKLNEAHQIIAITRESGSLSPQLTLDYFDLRRSGQLEKQRREIMMAYRGLAARMDTQTLGPFTVDNVTVISLSIPCSIRGNYRSMFIDINSAGWSGQTVKMQVDAVDLYTGIVVNSHQIDTTSTLLTRGDRNITIVHTAGVGSVTVYVSLVPQRLV